LGGKVTLTVARSIYLRLREGAKFWNHGKEFTGLSQAAVRAALGAAAPQLARVEDPPRVPTIERTVRCAPKDTK